MLAARLLTDALRAELSSRRTTRGFGLDDLLRSGVANPDSSVGVYAPDAESYAVFAPLLEAVVLEHHGLSALPPRDRPPPGLFADPRGEIGSGAISTRVRVARNLAGFPLPAGLTGSERLHVEQLLSDALSSLPGDLAGRYHRLGDLSEAERAALIDAHLLFKPGDRFLDAAGITRGWPEGRGIYLSDDRRLVAWVGEEDHLRLISIQPGGDLGAVASRLGRAHAHLAARLDFAWDPHLGFLASCPSNLGTGMRASVHARVAADPDRARDLGLQLRGTAGEHTESEGGVHDVSNAHRLGITEDEVLATLAAGLSALASTGEAT